MYRQQEIVVVSAQVMEHERQIAQRVRSHNRAAIVVADEAREAADAQGIRIADIKCIAALTKGGDRLSR
jgi:hypothetical protein